MGGKLTASRTGGGKPAAPPAAQRTGPRDGMLAGVAAQLQRAPAVQRLAAMVQRQPEEAEKPLQGKFPTVQRAAEDEELMQGRFVPAQRAAVEEEEPLQGKFPLVQRAAEDEELMQGRFATVQRAAVEEEEPLQGKFPTVQRAAEDEELQMKAAPANNTGLPDGLKSGVEALSGMSMDGVKVHYNSAKPAQLNAHAYAQGTDIHLAPGQAQHLPHEAWHVVQQAQGRVKPTMQMKPRQMKMGVPVNDDVGLEREADEMGARALGAVTQHKSLASVRPTGEPVAQRELTTYEDIEASAKNKKFSWTRLRTDISNQNEKKAGSAKGFGVDTLEGTTLTTKIDWKPVDSVSGEGTGVNAKVLGPDHRLGSEPQAGKGKVWNKRRVALSKQAGNQKYIAGHLLNNNLGGPGDDARNLTAIPATVNTTQSSNIEEKVKTLVNEDLRFVRYEVDVAYAGAKAGRYASKITSKWNPLDKDGNDAGPERVVALTIPAPASFSAEDDVDIDDNDTVTDVSGATKAVVDPEKDIILNNTGYLKVATTVQKTFKAAIIKIRNELDLAKQDLEIAEGERDYYGELIDGMEDDLLETSNQLDETKRELEETISRLDSADEENDSLIEAIEQLEEACQESKKEIEKLQQTIKEYELKVDLLEKEKEEIEKEKFAYQISHAVSTDLGLFDNEEEDQGVEEFDVDEELLRLSHFKFELSQLTLPTIEEMDKISQSMKEKYGKKDDDLEEL